MDSLLTSIIYKSILMIFLIFIYVYGIHHWRANKHHFVIANRFRIVSYFILGLVFCLFSISLLGDILMHLEISDPRSHEKLKFIKVSAAFTVCSLATARSFAMYKRFKFMESILNYDEEISFTQRANTIQFRLIIIYTLIGTICIPLLSPIVGAWVPLLFFVSLSAVIVAIIIVMLRNKLRDHIGCMKEIMALCIVCLIINISLPLPHQILSVLGFTAMSIVAVVMWCTPLVYIRRMKQTKLPPKPAVVETDATIIYDIPSRSGPDDTATPSVNRTQLDQPLYMFLKDERCYILFRKYLAHCFAVECLMFLESVVILCHFLTPHSVGTLRKTQHKEQGMVQLILAIKFDFVMDTTPYKEYKLKIESVCDGAWEQQRSVYFELCMDIFNTFLSANALYQINISGDVRQPLQTLFQSQSLPAADSHTFKNVDDFICIYQDAMLETYKLITTVYAFNFRRFISKRTTR